MFLNISLLAFSSGFMLTFLMHFWSVFVCFVDENFFPNVMKLFTMKHDRGGEKVCEILINTKKQFESESI
jgi:hypothetical protein